MSESALVPARVLARPKLLAIACIAMLVAAGWVYLGLALAGLNGVTAFQALCQPSFGASGVTGAQVGVLFAMWGAMALAMMLPDRRADDPHLCGARRNRGARRASRRRRR